MILSRLFSSNELKGGMVFMIRAMRDGTTKAAVAHAEVLKEEEQA